MAEKRDVGGLDDDDEKRKHESDRGRTGLLVGIPALGVAVLGGLMFAFAGTGDKEPKQPDPPRADSAPLTDFTTDKFIPSPQRVEPITSQPPPDIDALVKVLEARQQAVADNSGASQQAIGSGGTQAQTQSTTPKKVVRSVSITQIARPDGGSGGMSQASMGGEGRHGNEDGDGSRQGAMFSKNRLEKAYKCQASAGTTIPAMLPQGFNTEQEGVVIAKVTAHVYSKDKRCLAIPMDSDLIGVYKTSVARGQARVTIEWDAIERPYPASDTIDLDGVKAYERDGRAGLTGEVNSNIPWGMIVASTIIDLGKAALGGLGDGDSLNFGSIIGNNAGSVLDEVARDRYQKAPASIDVEPKPILVRLNKHLPMSPFPQ